MVGRHHENNMAPGLIWAIVAGVGFGFFQLVNREAVKQLDIYVGTFILLTVSAVVLGTLSFATEGFALLGRLTFVGVGFFALAGLIHFFIGWTLLSASQRIIGAARTSVILGATPLFATLIGIAFFGELLSLPTTVGILLVVAGVYIVTGG